MTIGMDFVSKVVEVAEDTSISKKNKNKKIFFFLFIILRFVNMRYCWLGFFI